jgi:hypothetical protein
MDLIKFALPLVVTALATWAYFRREQRVDQRLGFQRDDGNAQSDALRRAPIKETLRRLPGAALMVATLVLMQKSSGFAKAALALFVVWIAVEGFRVRVWPHKKRGADSREVRDLTLFFLAMACGLAVFFWKAVANQS